MRSVGLRHLSRRRRAASHMRSRARSQRRSAPPRAPGRAGQAGPSGIAGVSAGSPGMPPCSPRSNRSRVTSSTNSGTPRCARSRHRSLPSAVRGGPPARRPCGAPVGGPTERAKSRCGASDTPRRSELGPGSDENEQRCPRAASGCSWALDLCEGAFGIRRPFSARLRGFGTRKKARKKSRAFHFG